MPLGEPQVTSEDYETLTWATVVLQNVHRGLEPQVQPGEVKEICVVEEVHKPVRTDVANRAFGFQFPVISCGATYAAKRVWGFAAVGPDGSACFQVPARRPIYFLALDAHGRAVQRMRTFTHLMPGEIQGCVGCHEPRQQTTLAAHPRLPYPAPQSLRPPEWGQGVGFDYSALVQPVLDRYCVSCHSGNQPAGNVDLCGDKTDFFNVSYEFLARGRKRAGEAEWDNPYTSWIPTYNGMEQNILQITPKAWGSPASRLADLLLAGHPAANGQRRVTLDSASLRRIFLWIDLNVPYYGASETAYPEKKGCRQLYPPDLDKTLAEVAARRCAGCHEGGKVPRPFWTRLQNPQRNSFLLAPLAVEAGGTGKCGQAVFADAHDPDYQALLRTFDPVLTLLQQRPRMDMPGARPAPVDRSCLGSVP
jgi:cytochrome c553